MKIILGSQSWGRRRVLDEAGYEFDVMPADIDEKAIRHDDHQKLPLLIARAKADALVSQISEAAVLVTADTITIFGGELREKPETSEQARRYLETYSADEPIIVITAVTVTNTATNKRAEGVDVVELTIGKLPPELVEEIAQEPRTLTVAGGFTTFDARLRPYIVKRVSSTSSVAGLPLKLMEQLIAEVAT